MLIISLNEFLELGVCKYEAWVFKCSKFSLISNGFDGYDIVVTGAYLIS